MKDKYKPYQTIDFPNRQWPDQAITQAPIWCSVDLRDGNQALSVPMGVEEKLEMFDLLVNIGFKEIEVGFPAAAKVEFDFVRKLIDEKRIPKDVTIQVLTQAREPLIRKTFEAIKGCNKAIVHLYNSTSTIQRKVVFNKSQEEITKIAADAARLIKELKTQSNSNGIRFQYSPESFTATELDYSLDICHAVLDIWEPTKENPVIINLPATVELSTPNVYADRIEWFHKNLRKRDAVILSLHTHNDRGTGVAAAELGLMAGADRIEGALFGNGERTGNMDIVTMALNMYTQGVDPELDFTDIKNVESVYKRCTRMDVHPRHPYAGDLVFTAFSGSHQDAIHKGMKAQQDSGEALWDVPYLPIDPKDIGRDYEFIIRINSQSGKGGIAHVMERDWGIFIPKPMQPDFAEVVQKQTEKTGNELTSKEIHQCFVDNYLQRKTPYQLKECTIHTVDELTAEEEHNETDVSATIKAGENTFSFITKGNGPVDAFVHGIKEKTRLQFKIALYAEHALGSGSDAEAITYVGLTTEEGRVVYGAGTDVNISTASINALLSAINGL